MTDAERTPLSIRFAAVFDMVARLLRARQGGPVLTMAVSIFVMGWLRRKQRSLERLIAELNAGTLRAPRRRNPRPATCDTTTPKRHRCERVPADFGWLIALVPNQLGAASAGLRDIIATADIAALVQAAPWAVRYIRPLCFALAVQLPDGGVPKAIWPSRPYRMRQIPAPPLPIPVRVEPESAALTLTSLVMDVKTLTVFFRR